MMMFGDKWHHEYLSIPDWCDYCCWSGLQPAQVHDMMMMMLGDKWQREYLPILLIAFDLTYSLHRYVMMIVMVMMIEVGSDGGLNLNMSIYPCPTGVFITIDLAYNLLRCAVMITKEMMDLVNLFLGFLTPQLHECCSEDDNIEKKTFFPTQQDLVAVCW